MGKLLRKRGRPAGDKSLVWFANWRKDWFDSQEELGTLLGFGRDSGDPATQISNWETGRNGVNVGLLRRSLLKSSGRPREALEDFEDRLKRNSAFLHLLLISHHGSGAQPKDTTSHISPISPIDQLSLQQRNELKVSGVPVDGEQGLMELVTKKNTTPHKRYALANIHE